MNSETSSMDFNHNGMYGSSGTVPRESAKSFSQRNHIQKARRRRQSDSYKHEVTPKRLKGIHNTPSLRQWFHENDLKLQQNIVSYDKSHKKENDSNLRPQAVQSQWETKRKVCFPKESNRLKESGSQLQNCISNHNRSQNNDDSEYLDETFGSDDQNTLDETSDPKSISGIHAFVNQIFGTEQYEYEDNEEHETGESEKISCQNEVSSDNPPSGEFSTPRRKMDMSLINFTDRKG